MTVFKLIIKSFIHYFKSNILFLLGIGICTMIITGPLIVGDSLKKSLEKTVFFRLGNINSTISAGNRLFTIGLGERIQNITGTVTSSALITEGVAVYEGGSSRVNNVQVLGIDSDFSKISNSGIFNSIGEEEAIISSNLADRLNLKENDFFLLRINKESVIPHNTPFVAEKQIVAKRIKVKAIAGKDDLGYFNLNTSQIPPFNVFVDINWLNKISDTDKKANYIFLNEEIISVREILSECILPEDVNLRIDSAYNEFSVTSEKVFIDENLSSSILKAFPYATPVLTYFVNSFTSRSGEETPYSFVASMNDDIAGDSSVTINRWLAEDLNVSIGDTIELSYFVIGPLKELTEKTKAFKINKIVEIEGKFSDSTLMPYIPGLTDAGNCRDWDTDVPIDLEKIRDKDEEYWKNFKGTPKAFISLSEGQNLWKNRFGNLTSIKINLQNTSYEEVGSEIRRQIDPTAQGFEIKKVKEDGLFSARNGVDFKGLFFGLSFFILLSGIVLCSLLFIYNVERRSTQIDAFVKIGYTSQLIRKIFLSEGLFISILGSAVGIFFAILYNKLIFLGLNKVWHEIVRMNVLETSIKTQTLVLGFAISIIVSYIIISLSLRFFMNKYMVDLTKPISKRNKRKNLFGALSFSFLSVALLIIAYQIFIDSTIDPMLFFISGVLLLTAFLIFANLVLIKIDSSIMKLNLFSLSVKNLVRNRTRSFTVIILLAIGTFVVTLTGSYRKDLASGANLVSGGAGGFSFFAEFTVPFLKNLDDPKIREEFGIDSNIQIVQFKVNNGDDASCLNLNRVANPRIMGVKPELLSGRFSFISFIGETDGWSALNKKRGNIIPAIADETVIKWGLGKKTGDTLLYLNEKGDTLKLKLIGGLSNSIFQGNIIIADTFFVENFPTVAGSKVFLIRTNSDTLGIKDKFYSAFRDYGLEMEPAVERLAKFNTVEDTYLNIFFALGYIGLFLGTVGLIIILLRSIFERKNELAILTAAGFKRSDIFRLFIFEYGILLISGLTIGIITSVVGIMPQIISGFQSNIFIILILGFILLVHGFLWISLIAWWQPKKINLTEYLRSE